MQEMFRAGNYQDVVKIVTAFVTAPDTYLPEVSVFNKQPKEKPKPGYLFPSDLYVYIHHGSDFNPDKFKMAMDKNGARGSSMVAIDKEDKHRICLNFLELPGVDGIVMTLISYDAAGDKMLPQIKRRLLASY